MISFIKDCDELELSKKTRWQVALSEAKTLFLFFCFIQRKLAMIPDKIDLTHSSYSFVLCFCVYVIHLKAHFVPESLLEEW